MLQGISFSPISCSEKLYQYTYTWFPFLLVEKVCHDFLIFPIFFSFYLYFSSLKQYSKGHPFMYLCSSESSSEESGEEGVKSGVLGKKEGR